MSVNPQSFTLAEFLAWEARQTVKHEYRDGTIFAMAGATDDHNQLVANLITLIRPSLSGSACRIYPQDMKVVTDFPGSRYPDIVVTCDPRDANDKVIKRHPKLLIEVLSQGTSAIDTDDKLDEYQTIPELEEYVLVDSRRSSVRMYRRNANKWETEPATIAGTIELRSLGITLALAEIYEDVEFTRKNVVETEERDALSQRE